MGIKDYRHFSCIFARGESIDYQVFRAFQSKKLLKSTNLFPFNKNITKLIGKLSFTSTNNMVLCLVG
jgi:hypothetical protein